MRLSHFKAACLRSHIGLASVRHVQSIRAAALAGAAVAGCVLTGCGSSDTGAGRIPLKGAVTFSGAPVPHGDILFVPDTNKGNKGPAGVATIQDGRYATLPGKGAVAGPVIAIVSGYSSKELESDAGAPKPLFLERRVELVLAGKGDAVDIAIPDAATPVPR